MKMLEHYGKIKADPLHFADDEDEEEAQEADDTRGPVGGPEEDERSQTPEQNGRDHGDNDEEVDADGDEEE